MDSAWLFAGQSAQEAVCPRILLVDDDPLYCKAVKRAAKKMNLDITVCKTFGEITSLNDRKGFDVAILDYFFGELTGFQLSHFIGPEIPVVLVSNTEARKISGDAWPAGIRTFVHKEQGIQTLLAEAMLTCRWKTLFHPAQPPPSLPDLLTSPEVKWPSLIAILIAAIALGAALLFAPTETSRSWRWDKAPTNAAVEFSLLTVQGGKV